jgi:effector-binding domain-containing protein
MKITLPQLTSGVNGAYSWEDKDGIGTMKTLGTDTNTSIKQEMQFADYPSSDINWEFKSNNNGTTDVTWTISGKDLPFGFKAFSLFSGGMEKQIAPHYERSLEKLDSIVIADMKKYSVTVNGVTNHSGGYYLYNTASCKIDELANKISQMLPKVVKYAEENHITQAGKPFVNYIKWDVENNAAIFSSCIPTTERVITLEGGIITGELPRFKAIKTTLKGNHSNLNEAWETTKKYILKNGFEATENGPMIEAYITDKKNNPNPANWITEIYIAIKDTLK